MTRFQHVLAASLLVLLTGCGDSDQPESSGDSPDASGQGDASSIDTLGLGSLDLSTLSREQLLDRMLAQFDQLNGALEIVDRQSAALDVKAELESLSSAMIKTMEQIQKLGDPSAEQIESLESKYKPLFNQAGATMKSNLATIRTADPTAGQTILEAMESFEKLRDVTPDWLR